MSTTTPNQQKVLGTLSPKDVPLHQLPVIELSAKHVRRAGELARDRNESYDQIDGGTTFGENDSLTSHQTGILGEMAIAELFASDIDTEVHPFGDGGIDLDLWGATADVKATKTNKMQYPQLLVCEDNELNADLYFLTHVINSDSNGARIRVLGYGTKEQVESKTPYRHPGSTKNYVVDPEELTLTPLLQAAND
jgi:hypothetical protein